MGKQEKPKKDKVIRTRREPTPSVESSYQVSWLVGEVNEAGKRANGQWMPEGTTRRSFGRKALVKHLKGLKSVGQFKVRKVA